MKTITIFMAGLFIINFAMGQCSSTAGTISGGTSPLCSGDYTGILSLTGGSGSFTWQRNEYGQGWLDIGPPNQITTGQYTASGVEGNIQFRVAYCTSGTPIYTNEITIEVYNPNGGTVTGGGTICSGSTPSSLSLTGALGNFNWQYSYNNSTYADIGGTANQTTYTPNISSGAGTYEYRVVAACGSNADAYSNEVTLIVNGASTAAICNDGDDLRKAVAKVHLSSVPYDFTGFLVNHAEGDGRLLFLTTSHPFTRYSPSSSVLNNATFTWNEDITACTGGSSVTAVTSIGCSVVATDGFFTLLQLNTAPALAELYYLGWDINATGNYSSIFQTAASIKKARVASTASPSTCSASISNSTDALTETSGSGVFKIASWTSGNTEKRGRGAPLIAANKKARGVYIGGTEASCGNGPSYFAHLHSGMTGLLSYLRDGSETNSATVHMNYCKPGENLSGNFDDSKTFSVSGSITSSQNIVNGNSVKYQAGTYIELTNGFSSGTDFIGEINPCVSTVYTIAAKTDNEEVYQQKSNEAENLDNTNWLKIYPTVLSSGSNITIEANGAIDDVEVRMLDLQGSHILSFRLNNFLKGSSVSIPIRASSGMYLLKANDGINSFTQKIIIQ